VHVGKRDTAENEIEVLIGKWDGFARCDGELVGRFTDFKINSKSLVVRDMESPKSLAVTTANIEDAVIGGW
jgi:hypothetical protein